MFINKNSLKVTVGSTTTNLGDYIVEAKYGYNKLWSKDSGRNLAGAMTGSLTGIFPKIIVQFRILSQSELEEIANILDSPLQTISYYDPKKRQQTSMQTYTGDWEVVNRSIQKNQGFSCSFISTKKRS